MKQVNFKINLIALAILAMVSCGSKGNKQQDGANPETNTGQVAASSSAELKDVDESNWQTVLKANFGIDYELPEGWSFKEAYSPNKKNNLKLFLHIGGSITGEDMGNMLFEKTEVLSEHGNFQGNVDWDAGTVSAGDALTDFDSTNSSGQIGAVISKWNYTFNSRMVMINYYTAKNTAEYTFTLN